MTTEHPELLLKAKQQALQCEQNVMTRAHLLPLQSVTAHWQAMQRLAREIEELEEELQTASR